MDLRVSFPSSGKRFCGLRNDQPPMHKKEETEAVTAVFDGEIEIFEKEVEGKSRKFIAIRRLYGRKYNDQEKMI